MCVQWIDYHMQVLSGTYIWTPVTVHRFVWPKLWFFPVVRYRCESWTMKNRCFWIVVLKKILESPLGYKEIKPVNPKGSQSWIFIGRTDAEAEAEASILWPPHVKSQLIGKDPDAWKDWRQEGKVSTEDEMVKWHYWLDGHEFEQTLGDSEGLGSLAYCSSWDGKELDMTEQQSNNKVAARRIWKQRHAFFSKELLRFWETFFAFLLSPPNDLPVLRSTPWPFQNGLNCISDKWVLKLHKVVTELPVCLLLLRFWVTTASTNNLGISRGLPCDLFTEWEICEPGLERTLPQSRYSLQDDSNRMTTPFRISLD